MWGDSAGHYDSIDGTVISGPNGSFKVVGSHQYKASGVFDISTLITPKAGSYFSNDNLLPFASTMAAGSAVISDLPFTVSPTQSQLTFAQDPTTGWADTGSMVVATLADPDLSDSASSYHATIYWGDGGGYSTAGTVTGSAGTFQISGENRYYNPGHYVAYVDVYSFDVYSGEGGPSVTASFDVTVTPAVLPAGVATIVANSITATDGTVFSGAVATFALTDPQTPVNELTATIDWGDETTNEGQIVPVAGQSGVYEINGRHT